MSLCFRGTLTNRIHVANPRVHVASPPSAAASRLDSGPDAMLSSGKLQPDGDNEGRMTSEVVGMQKVADDSVLQPTSFHLSGDVSDDNADRHPTGTNSPSFLESLRINTRIVSTSTLDQLYQVVLSEIDNIERCELGSVNASSALHRATVLWKEHVDSSSSSNGSTTQLSPSSINAMKSEHVDPIVEVLYQPLCNIVTNGEHVKPYDIAISMWSLATLRKADDKIMDVLSQRLLTMLDRLNATDMAHIMWACGSVQYLKSPTLLEGLLAAAVRQVGEFKPCELSTFVWGMCKTSHNSNPMLSATAERLLSSPEEFATEEMVRLLWAFTKCRFCAARDAGVFAVALHQLSKHDRLHSMLPQDYANLMWAMAGLKVPASPVVLNKFADCCVLQLRRFKTSELANVVYGFGSLMHRHDELLLAAADEVVRRGKQMSNQELCMIVWAFGKLGVVPEDGILLATASSEFYQRMKWGRLSPLTMSNVIKAFAKLEYMPGDVFMHALSESVLKSLKNFRMAEMSNLLWAYQQLEWVDTELFERCEQHAIDNLHSCTGHHIGSIVYSFKHSGYSCERLLSAARRNEVV